MLHSQWAKGRLFIQDVCHSWQYLIGHMTAPLFAATQDSKETQNCPKHSQAKRRHLNGGWGPSMEAPSNEAESGPETGSNIRSRFWPPYCDITRTLGWQSFTRSTIQTKVEEKRISWKWKMPSRSDEHGVNKKSKSRNYRNGHKKLEHGRQQWKANNT